MREARDRARRRRHRALAGARGRGAAARPEARRRACAQRVGGGRVRRRRGPRAQRFKIELGKRVRWCARCIRPQRWRFEHGDCRARTQGQYGPAGPALRRRRQGHRRGATTPSDVPLAQPGLCLLVTSAIARGRIDGHRSGRGAERSPACSTSSPTRTPEKLKEAKLFSGGGYASTTIQPLKSAEIAARRPDRRRGAGRNLRGGARGRPSGARSTTPRRTPSRRRSIRQGDDAGAGQGPARAAQGRSEGRRLRRSGLRRGRGARSRPTTRRRPSTTTRWSCSPPPASGTATG